MDRDHDGKKYWQLFTSVSISLISRIEDNHYSATAQYRQEHAEGEFSEMMVTFDFDSSAYNKLLLQLPYDIRERVQKGLSRQPYHVLLKESGEPVVSVFAWPGDNVHQNENESYCPFIAEEFIAHPRTVTVRSRVLAKAEPVECGWIGNAIGSEGIIATGAASTEEEVVETLQCSVENYLATQAANWLQEIGYAGSPEVLNCPEGAIKLPIDTRVCKIALQTCPIQAQVFVKDPERFFAGCLVDEERKQRIFKAVSEWPYREFDHLRGRYLCTRCEDENGCESLDNYHYPWELSSLEDFAPFVRNRDMLEVVRKLMVARIPRSAVHNALCARHSIELTTLLYPEVGANLRVLEFETTLAGAAINPFASEELHSEG